MVDIQVRGITALICAIETLIDAVPDSARCRECGRSLADAPDDAERCGKCGRLLGPGPTFGGYKQSGNGREWGVNGFEEFLETKAVLGYVAKT